MFLTYTELVELTEKKRSSSQAKTLDKLGILYRVRPDGSIAVAKAHVEQILGVMESSIIHREPELRM